MLCGCVTSPTRQGSRRDETKRDSSGRLGRPQSPPVRGRGLKRTACLPQNTSGRRVVAPRAGARIETRARLWQIASNCSWASPPVRGRGLKPGHM